MDNFFSEYVAFSVIAQMCNCFRDSTLADVVDTPRLTTYSQNLVDLLKNDVFLVMFDSEGNSIWQYASSTEMTNEYGEQLQRIKTIIYGGEEAIRQLNTGWRIDELASFRLNCQSSRIFVCLLTDTYRLVVINRYNAEEGKGPTDAPDLNQSLKQICGQIKSCIKALSAPHVN